MEKIKRFIPDKDVCARYGISPMTLWRWDRNPALKFPKPIRINRRKYRDEKDLESFEQSRISKAAG